MESETPVCNQCRQSFVLTPEDFGFYAKFGVSRPAMCPSCRVRHRLSFKNERSFYRRACDKCAREVISMYSPNKPYTVWCYECYFADDWDAIDYGVAYDPARPFMPQFEEMWRRVPKVALIYVRSVNSEYVNISADNKNCYLLVESSNNENSAYCYWIQQCRDLVDVSFSHKTELSYECDDCFGGYRLQHCKSCHECRESYFLLDCVGCSDCLGCVGLRSKQYYIFNKPHTKEEYVKILKDARLDTFAGREAFRKKFEEFAIHIPRKYAEILNAPHSTGNYIKNAKNCTECFHCYDAENCRYNAHVWRGARECMDCDTAGRGAEMIYNSINAGIDTSHYIATTQCWSSSFMEYSHTCMNSNNCFGCAGLRKKDYCILNRQYSKEEYERIKNDIVDEMRRAGEYGEFFPQSINSFGYNESAAMEQFPLEKSEAADLGFSWEDYPRGTFGKETIAWQEVPDRLGGFDVSGHIFACEECRKNYRIIPSEFIFYQKLDIPLPRLCPDCRHARRIKARGPNRLWRRQCMCNKVHPQHSGQCPNEFETSYAPERPEIVYCEACYQQEIS